MKNALCILFVNIFIVSIDVDVKQSIERVK